MAQRTRAILKSYFETGDKPTESQFSDFIESVFNIVDDGGIKVKQLLELLTGTSRLNKSAIRGADFALNRRGKGDIFSGQYTQSMNNILPGDFWIYGSGELPPPEFGEIITLGDWVIAMREGLTAPFDFTDEVNWQIQHFGDTTVNQQTVELKHLRMSPTVSSATIRMAGINAIVINVVINKLTYMGKADDGEFGNNDYVFRYVDGVGTEIQLNEDLLGFRFEPSMVIDIMYKLNN